MKTKLSVALILVLTASPLPAVTNNVTVVATPDPEHQNALLAYVPENPFVTSRSAARLGYVPTNTLAFREYALDLMLTQANVASKAFRLDLPKPLTTDHASGAGAVPKISGIKGAIAFSNRFSFSFEDGKLAGYCDRLYWSASWTHDLRPALATSVSTNGEMRSTLTIEEAYQRGFEGQAERNRVYHQKMMGLTQLTNQLTKAEALRIGQEALHKLGFTEKQLQLREQPEVNQFTYSPEGQNVTYPLPLFHVGWQHRDRENFQPVRMEISGVTKTVVDYFNVAADSIIVSVPTNYYQMLGVAAEPRLWGRHFGYDPINTPAFQSYARTFVVEKANWLIQTWRLETPEITTNQLDWFQATPHTNTFMVSARFANNRYELQIGEGIVQIFHDSEQDADAYTDSRSKLDWILKQKNQLTKTSALSLAREALARIGIDEKKIQIPSPRVIPVRGSLPNEEKLHSLPFYNIEWKWTNTEEEFPVMAMQISGVTKKITMFGISSTNAPRFALPSNYSEILGLP